LGAVVGLDRTHYTGQNPTLMASGIEATQAGALTGPSRSAGGMPAVLARGSSIGRYTVLQMLGAGGMGVVYAAFDPELDRKVAIKLLHVELVPRGGTSGATRLLREAQAMARLSHPNVIAVHDVGTHDGQVFMAMEFVEGHTLGDELEARPRGWREVVALYVAAGRGLAAAHRSGLVHRDFKPDNVMIDRDGRVRVLDFGLACSRSESPLAKIDATSMSSLDIRMTATGAVMGTPAYMSPEQHVGEVADERSDQFAFCVALYEALYGERPFAGDSLPEVVAAVTQGQIRGPRAGSRVPGWIRRVLLRGLSVWPEQRWKDMATLLAALERDPARRRRVWLGLGLAALVVGGGAAAVQQQLAARAQLCTGSHELLAGVWDAERAAAGRAAFAAVDRPYAAATWDTVAAELDEYTAAWAATRDDACAATRIRGEQSDELLDRRMACARRQIDRVGTVVDMLGAADAAVVERAVEVVTKLPEPAQCADITALMSPVEQPADAEIAETAMQVRQHLDAAFVTFQLGKQQAGVDQAKVVVAEARALGFRPVLAESLMYFGQMQSQIGMPKEGEAALEEAMLVAEASRHDRVVAQSRISMTTNLTLGQNRYADAHRMVRMAQAAVDRLGGDDRLQSEVLGRESVLAHFEGEMTLSTELGYKALALAEGAYGPDHLVVADIVNNLAINERGRGLLPEAEKLYERALGIWTRKLGVEHPKRGSALTNLSMIHRTHKQIKLSEDELREALALYEKSFPPDHPEIAITLNALAQLMAGEEHFAEAEALAVRALKIFEAKYGPKHRNTGAVRATIGGIQVRAGRHDEAIVHMTRASEILAEVHGPDHPAVAHMVDTLADVHESKKDFERALAEYQRSVAMYQRHDKNDSSVASPMLGEGRVLVELGKPKQAVPVLEKALALASSRPDWLARDLATIRVPLAKALWVTPSERPRALKEAQMARAAWVGEENYEDRLAKLEAWLATHTLP